ncbi:hypothetical protein BU26DRAFT_589624 [Trematosphaeria pertusa]|uniref:Uncharacterized protein n=1 Tax=Trematosphaeria pertusa TaxID=390896 RepID=A0A6A6HRW4_9PLEO|nr:uncharacterized protein BU26DRAFT_589624 [Trematosphaeria pertusa]KAF2240283.1 hypothetical protein BU26DRAFT_589624 [Trematosphaeria pertusa]
MSAAQSNSVMSDLDSAPNPPTSDTSNPTSQQGNALPTGYGEIDHGNGSGFTPASTILPPMTDEDRREMGFPDPSNQTGRGTSPTAANGSVNHGNERAQGNSGARTVNGESYRGNQPTSINITNYLDDWSAEEWGGLEEAISSQNNEPSASMDEFWTLERDGFDPFNTTPASHRVTNGNVPNRGHASDPMRRLDTPLPTGDVVENSNARSLDDEPSVYVSDLQLGTPTEEMLAMLAPLSHYSEDEASSAALGEDTTASSQADPTTLTSRRYRRAVRRVGSLRQMTPEEIRTF